MELTKLKTKKPVVQARKSERHTNAVYLGHLQNNQSYKILTILR